MKKVIISAIMVLMVMGVACAQMEEDQTGTQNIGADSSEMQEDQAATQDMGVSPAKMEDDQTAAKVPATITQPPTAMIDEIVTKKKSELNGTKWSVELKSMDTVKGKGKVTAETDVVSFSEGKVMSETLAGLGYEATGFTARMEEDGTLIWETMQTSEKDGTAFWRGDVGPDGVMRGVLSKRDLKEKVKDYNFVGKAQ